MKRGCNVVWILVLALAGCGKGKDSAPAPKPDYEAMAAAMDAADEERAARAHLTSSMTDEQILRAIGADPTMLKLKPAPDGYGGPSFRKTAYTNETTDIEISRSLDTGGLLVYKLMPVGQQNRWLVKGKAP